MGRSTVLIIVDDHDTLNPNPLAPKWKIWAAKIPRSLEEDEVMRVLGLGWQSWNNERTHESRVYRSQERKTRHE
jgi:hypothetical protein